MKDQCVIFCGLTRMTDVVGEFHQEEQVTHLGKTLQSNSTIRMVSLISTAHQLVMEGFNWCQVGLQNAVLHFQFVYLLAVNEIVLTSPKSILD